MTRKINMIKALVSASFMATAFFAIVGARIRSQPAVFSTVPPDIYRARCASCHGGDGRAGTPAGKALKVRDLHSDEVQGMSDDELYKVVADGKGKMPAFGKKLSEEQIRELVNRIRGFR